MVMDQDWDRTIPFSSREKYIELDVQVLDLFICDCLGRVALKSWERSGCHVLSVTSSTSEISTLHT
jgi:hypothetical protein